MRTTLLAASTAIFILIGAPAALADAIPYGDPGAYNATTYTFTATATGDLVGYFVSRGNAGYDNEVGVLDNGVLTSGGFGLDNQSSSYGQSFDFGSVTAGDALTFVMQNNSLMQDVYSNAALNTAYDDGYVGGHNHIYSTSYSGSSSPYIPAGTYIGFEDEVFPYSDYNYNDESFVFTNTVVSVSAAPEPSAWALMLLGVGAIGCSLRLAKSKRRFDLAPAASA